MLNIIVDYSLKVHHKATLAVIGCSACLSSLLFLLFSVPKRPGAPRDPVAGMPRTPDGTGRVRPVRPRGRPAGFGQDVGPYRARHVSSGQGGWWTAGDSSGWQWTVGDTTSDVS